MKTDRRKFIQTLGTGAAGLGLAATVQAFAAEANKAQPNQVTNTGSTPRKMVIRADDVDYTNVCNIGTF